MFNTFYEYENKNIIDDNINEYCKAEHLNEEYFRFNMRENGVKNHSFVGNITAAVLLLSRLFKH